VLAKARRKPIDFEILKSCSPPEKERAQIAHDIKQGREALESSSAYPTPFKTKQDNSKPEDVNQDDEKKDDGAANSVDQSKTGRGNQERKPFERNVNRHPGLEVNLHDDD
jgi:hypothetical protein